MNIYVVIFVISVIVALISLMIGLFAYVKYKQGKKVLQEYKEAVKLYEEKKL